MKLYSTKNPKLSLSLKSAVLQGLSEDGGLFFPHQIPRLDPDFIRTLSSLRFVEIAQTIAEAFCGDEIPKAVLHKIVQEALVEVALVELTPRLRSLELFHGPTLAFKDFGARFMARLLSYFLQESDEKLLLLVATSGDTGSAVAHGFLGVPGIQVVVLYPQGKVSVLQEKQMTTLGENIIALEVSGTFDDCQALVKQAFLDPELTAQWKLSSANSINIARLLPQSFYYFEAYARLPDKERPVLISVPSGNFGNLTAGLLADEMGLPVKAFIAATNKNRVVPEYLETGVFQARPSQTTLSNAMDVGNPSNFARMCELYPSASQMAQRVWGISITESATLEALQELYSQYHYIADPHGAVAYSGLKTFLQKNPQAQGVFLETAHPAKFKEVVESAITGLKLPLPPALAQCLEKEKQAYPLAPEFKALKAFLSDL
jgi:threonine synthase